jgi:hypothetical protein
MNKCNVGFPNLNKTKRGDKRLRGVLFLCVCVCVCVFVSSNCGVCVTLRDVCVGVGVGVYWVHLFSKLRFRRPSWAFLRGKTSRRAMPS